MSKELEALERIRSHNYHELPKRECLKIIETALKDYDRRLKLAKEYEDVNNVAKRLKALEIIKEKKVDVELLMKTENAKDYNKYSKNVNQSHNLGQRQYDFLKEVLL